MRVEDVTMWGRDYSATDWEPHVLDEYERQNPRERPVQFLGRYIGYHTNRKCISHYPGLYRRHVQAGRPIFLFHQIGYTDMEGGYDRGRAHAQAALADARSDRVGWDGESHIVACMDRFFAKAGLRTLTPQDLREYMRGFRSVLGDRSGFYGFWDSMQHAVAEGWADFYVQCGARSAHIPGIHAWQENNRQPTIFGVPTDILELYTSRAHAFQGGDDMATVPQEEWNRVRDQIADNAEGKAQGWPAGRTFVAELAWRNAVSAQMAAQSKVLAELASRTPKVEIDPEDLEILRQDLRTVGEELEQKIDEGIAQIVEGLPDDLAEDVANRTKNMLYTQMFTMSPRPSTGT